MKGNPREKRKGNKPDVELRRTTFQRLTVRLRLKKAGHFLHSYYALD